MHRRLCVCCAFIALGLASPTTQAGTFTLDAAKDNTLYESVTGALSNGAGEFFFSGKTHSDLLRRGLIAFDIAGAVPPGSIIQSVTLTLHVSQSAPGSGPRLVELRRALADWGEGASDAGPPGGAGTAAAAGDATWLHTFFDTNFWAAAGGDFSATVSADTLVDADGFDYTWGSTPGMVADIQDWLDNPAGNFGWLLLGDEAEIRTAKRFDSSESSQPTFRPVLTVVTQPPAGVPTVSAWGLVIMTLAGFTAATLRGTRAHGVPR